MNNSRTAIFDPSINSWRALTPADLSAAGPVQPVSGPLTDAQLRATPVPVSLPAVTGGNAQVVVPTTGPVAPGAQAATRVVISNPNNHSVDVTQGGVAFVLSAESLVTFDGLTNLNQLTFTDGQAAPATYYLRWSA